MQRVEISATTASAPSLPMRGAWRTIRSYIFWQHERGTLHYDTMVTLILLFIFASPYWVNFNDKPVPSDPHLTDVVVTPAANGGLLYEISGSAVSPGDDASVRSQLLHIIEPISGAVSIVKYDAVKDPKGKIQSYRVWAKRE
ncbi:MAG: hypothetical protein WB919_23500 [Candidatus Sulfotelmatobacter sp.]